MKNKIKVDSIFSAPRVLTCQSFGKVKFKKEMNDLSMIKNGSIAVKDGLIIGTGKEKEINKKYFTNINQNIIFKKGILMPGFCDPHTHLVFGGSRANEIFQRLNGVSYQDIHKKGGGILYTVNQTRKESFSTLFNKAKNILELMMKHGTTSVEIKSGYGLDK